MSVLSPIYSPLLVNTSLASVNIEDDARLDVAAKGFWGSHHQRAFFDVKVFNLHAPSYRGSNLSSTCHKLEREKQQKYEQHICEVEMGCFTPLVFSTFGGMSTSSKRLAHDPYLLTRKTCHIVL